MLAGDRKTSHLVPSWQDIDVLESMKKALSPLAEFTDILSGEEYVTVSSLKPLLHRITNDVLKDEEDDTQLTKDIKRHVLTDVTLRYEDEGMSDILGITTFLDPRFKMDYVSDEDKEDVKEQVVWEETVVSPPSVPTVPATHQDNNIEPPPTKKRRLGTIFKKNSRQQGHRPEQLPPEERAKHEIEAYLKAPQPDHESDPLKWWKMEQHLKESSAHQVTLPTQSEIPSNRKK